MVSQTITVISGASRGLGRAAVRHLATLEGQLVVATARNPADLEPLRSQLQSAGKSIECRRLDVTDDNSVAALREWLAARCRVLARFICIYRLAHERFPAGPSR